MADPSFSRLAEEDPTEGPGRPALLLGKARKTLVRPGEKLKWGVWPHRALELHSDHLFWYSNRQHEHSGTLTLEVTEQRAGPSENEDDGATHDTLSAFETPHVWAVGSKQLSLSSEGHLLHLEFATEDLRDRWVAAISSAIADRLEERLARAAAASRAATIASTPFVAPQESDVEVALAEPVERPHARVYSTAIGLCFWLFFGALLIAYLQTSHSYCYRDATNLTECVQELEEAIERATGPSTPPAPPFSPPAPQSAGWLLPFWLVGQIVYVPFLLMGQFVGALLDTLLGACLALGCVSAVGLADPSIVGDERHIEVRTTVTVILIALFGSELLVRMLIFGDTPSTGSMVVGFVLTAVVGACFMGAVVLAVMQAVETCSRGSCMCRCRPGYCRLC